MTIRLSKLQQKIVAHDEGALLVVAGPGSGKTRVVTERIRRLLKTPKQHFRILALTFTNKAANEMVERLEDVDEVRTRAFVGTMHSFCTEVLANRGKSVGITGLPHLFESFQDRKQVLADAVQSDPELTTLLRNAGTPKQQSQRLDQWLASIGEAKNSLLSSGMVTDTHLRRIYEAYDSALRACGAVDFDDLLLLTYRLFEERPEVAAFYRRQYRYICVDEAQDLNEAQYRVLCALCSKEYFNILMVGDPKQAIYVWNGASPRYMDLFVKDFNADRIELNENFRSSRSVVAAAQALDSAYVVGGQLAIEGHVTIRDCATEEEEATFLVAELTRLIAKGHPDIEGNVTAERCGVLGRNRFVFRALEPLLVQQKIAFHKKVSAANYESESDVMEEFELALRVLSNPLDRLHLGAINSFWKSAPDLDAVYRGHDLRTVTGLAILEALCPHAKAGHCEITMKAVRAMRWTPEEFRFLNGLASIERSAATVSDDERALLLQDITEWKKHWNYFIRSVPGGRHSVPLFLNQVALGITQQPAQEGISLLTVHSAKGMEFDIVFVIGMTEGTFPDYRAAGETMNEERRNAFVAVTRSRRLLYLTWPKKKEMPWGDITVQKPSRFLCEIQSSLRQ